MAKTKLTLLQSVGTFLDESTGTTYPCCKDGTPDLDMAVNIADMNHEDDWIQSLSPEDRIVVNRTYKMLLLELIQTPENE